MATGTLQRASGDAPAASVLQWSDVFDFVPVPLWMMGVGGALCYGNRAWHAVTAAERLPSRRQGMGWLQAVHENDRDTILTALRAAAAEGRRVDVELRMGSTDGWRPWSLTGAPYAVLPGEVLMVVGAAHETTAAREADARLRDLSGRLVAAQEAERTRIARELHDDLAQRVALLATKLGAAGQRRPFTATLVRQDLAAARQMLHELSSSIHTLSHQLHPPNLRLLGLWPTLRALCREVSDGCGTPVDFTADDDRDGVADDTALCVFRVAQEALQNAIKHSGAGRIDVRLGATPSLLTLRVADDGCGFDPAASGHTGIGLLTMRERVELLRGSLRIVSKPGGGTLVEAVLPHVPAPPRFAPPGPTHD
jgi:signal transduction histidine kinase